MSGFVAPPRAVQARPRLSRIERQAFAWSARADGGVEDPATDGTVSAVDVVERPELVSERRSALVTRWQAIRERWAQATFYLFDGNAWR